MTFPSSVIFSPGHLVIFKHTTMPSLEKLTQADIPRYISESSYKKGRSYINQVRDPRRIGNRLQAKVQGTRLYNVELEVAASSIPSACTCSWGGSCKHVAAVLLKWLYEPNIFKTMEREPTIASKDGQRYPIEMIAQEVVPTTPQKNLPLWMQFSFEQSYQEQRKIFENILENLTIAELRAIASANKWKVKGTRKADLASQLIESMLNGSELQRALNGLDAEHHAALTAVAILGHIRTVNYATIEKIAGSLTALRTHKRFTTYLDHLFDAGLILYSLRMQNLNHLVGLGYGEWATVPTMRLRVIPPLLQGWIPSSQDLPNQGGTLQLADGSRILRAFEQLILMFEIIPTQLRPPLPRPVLERFHQSLRGWDFDPQSIYEAERTGALQPRSSTTLTLMLPQRSLPEEAIQQFAPIPGDEVQLEFLYHLLLASGLIQPGSPITVRPQVRDEFFSRDDASKRAILARTWFTLDSWNEIWEVVRQQPKLTLRLVQPNHYGVLNPKDIFYNFQVAYRKLVVSALALLPDNQWIALDDLFKFLQAWWKDFDHIFWSPDLRAYSMGTTGPLNHGYWHLAHGTTVLTGDKMEDWLLGQGNFIRMILQGPLSWLGLADLYVTNGTVTHFRLHGLGNLFFNRSETTSLPKAEQGAGKDKASAILARNAVKVHEDSINLIPSQVSGRLHTLLERIAHRESAQPDQFTYRLNIATAHQSFEAGLAVEDVQRQWQELLGEDLPKPIATRLNQWWQSYGQVRLYRQMTIIEFGDDHALTEMKALTSLNSLMLVELSPRLVVIPKDAVTPLMNELQKAGYTPKQVD